MKKALVSAIAVLVLFSASKSFAASFPANLTLSSASSLNLTLLDFVNISLKPTSGFLDTTIEQTGTAPPVVNVSVVDGLLLAPNGPQVTPIGTVTLTDIGLQLGPGGPFDNVTDSNPGTLDISGMPIAISQGTLSGTLLGFDVNLDFATDPVSFDLPGGTTATINETGGPTLYNVTLTIPVSIASTFDIDGVKIGAKLTGSLIFEGTKAIPEPGSIALLGLGLIGMAIPAVQRYRRK